MSNLLSFIAQETGGKTYSSTKFRFERIEMPKLPYDDKANIVFKRGRNGETDKNIVQPISIAQRAKDIQKSNKQLFKYFLDGSRKTYKLDDIAFDQRIYPIMAGQIGVGCCHRSQPDNFKMAHLEKQIVLSLPMCADKDLHPRSTYFTDLKNTLNAKPNLQKRGIQITHVIPYSDRQLEQGKRYEDRGVAKIQQKMTDLERKIVVDLAHGRKLNRNNYLLKDGSLEYFERATQSSHEWRTMKDSYRSVVGVSKSFDPELCKNNKGGNIAVEIADMPVFYRTPAYKYAFQEVLFCVWYLRLQSRVNTTGPFSGVIKVEKILVTEEEKDVGLESSEIDEISANLINERNPTAYGKDNRWANHLYPIYLTEKFIKSQYISDAHFIHLF